MSAVIAASTLHGRSPTKREIRHPDTEMTITAVIHTGAGNFIKAFRRVTYSILVKKRHVRNQTRPTLSYSVSILDTEDIPLT